MPPSTTLKTTIFLTGSTGYIGGTILSSLLSSPDAGSYDITALVRKDEQVEMLTRLGVKTWKGSLKDLGLLEKAGEEFDIVLNTASAQDKDSAVAFVKGLGTRLASGKPASMIHTSGSSILCDGVRGTLKSDKIMTDTSDIHGFEKSGPNAEYSQCAADLGVIAESEKSGVRVNIVAPPTIYGKGTGPGKKTPHQIRVLTIAGLRLGQIRYIGQGLPVWNRVHVQDLADLYVLLVEAVREGKGPKGKEGFFFAETGEHSWKELADAEAKVLHEKGILKHDHPIPFDDLQQAADLLTDGDTDLVNMVFASNSRGQAVKARETLGWNRRRDTFFEGLSEEFDFWVKEDSELRELIKSPGAL